MVLNDFFDVPTPFELIKITLRSMNNKAEWVSKSAIQKWCYLYGFGRAAANFLWFPIFREDPSTCWYSYFAFYYMGIDVVLVIYTTYYVLSRGEFEDILPSIPLLIGPVCASFPLLYVCVSKGASMYKSLIDFGGRYIHPNSKENSEYNDICSKQIDATINSFFTKMCMMFLSFIFAVFGPVYAYVMHGTKTTATSCRIPYTDTNSNEEFLVNFALTIVIGVHGFTGYIALEVSMALLNNVVTLIPKLIDLEFRKLDEDIMENDISPVQLACKLKNIIKQSLDTDKFLMDFGDLFYYRNLVTPSCFTYAIGLAIFCQFTMGFAAGYGLAMACYVQIYYVCEFGEDVEHNGFDEVLYNSNWYNLPLKYQNDIMHLINRKQNGVAVTVGPFGNINRVLFALITNKVYSFLMFLLNFTV